MKIEILCGEGSPDGVHISDIHGKNGRIGVGGAELALLTMCEAWAKAGREIVLYNNPKRQDGAFEQRPVASFDKHGKRDILIVFRQPTQKIIDANGKKIFWSCDQYTVGDFRHFAQFCDKVVTISPYHSTYFARQYEIRKSIPIDLPVRSWEYGTNVEKVPNRLIFTSVPDRGLHQVHRIFPRIRNEVPDVSIVITSDYRLWGIQSPNNANFVQMFMRQPGVEFLGAVQRDRLILEQQKAQIHFYPGVYEELFCIAVAESQVAGALPITSTTGALETTNMGVLINGNPNDTNVQDAFLRSTISYLRNPQLSEIQKTLRENAMKRFSIENIMLQWDEKVFNE